MKKASLLLLASVGLWGCVREEIIEDVNDPEKVYEEMRILFNRRVDSIGELHCLGELRVTGGLRFYVTLDYGGRGGVLEVFSPLRQRVGWMHFDPDTATCFFENAPGLSALGGYGFLIGWSLIGYPPFPPDVEIAKFGESRHSYYVLVKNEDAVYYFKVLRKGMVVQWMKVKRGDSSIDVNFRNHRAKGNHLFPHLLTGSTPEGPFELRYLEIQTE